MASSRRGRGGELGVDGAGGLTRVVAGGYLPVLDVPGLGGLGQLGGVGGGAGG